MVRPCIFRATNSDLIEERPLSRICRTFQEWLTYLSICFQENALVERPDQPWGCKSQDQSVRLGVSKRMEKSGSRDRAPGNRWAGNGKRSRLSLESESMTQSHKIGTQKMGTMYVKHWIKISWFVFSCDAVQQTNHTAIHESIPLQLLSLVFFIILSPQIYSIVRIKMMKPIQNTAFIPSEFWA